MSVFDVPVVTGDSSLSTHVQTLMAGLHNETTEWLAEYETKWASRPGSVNTHDKNKTNALGSATICMAIHYNLRWRKRKATCMSGPCNSALSLHL